jgi:hypothetical protein
MMQSAAGRDSAAQKMTHVGVPTEPRRGADWQRAHEELRRLARSRAGLDFEEGQWLLAAWRGGVHARLGYGSFREYIERLFGYGSRLVQDKLRVAEALEHTGAAIERGTGSIAWRRYGDRERACARAGTTSTDFGRPDHDPRSRRDPKERPAERAPAAAQVATVAGRQGKARR